MKDQNLKTRLIVLAVLTLMALWTILPSIQIHSQPRETKEQYLKDHPKEAAKSVKFGLDLAGGTSVVLELDTLHLGKGETVDELVNTSLEILRNRVDQFGLSEPLISRSGANRITVELAGVDQEGAKSLIGRTAKLEFKAVLPEERYVPALNRVTQLLRASTVLDKSADVKPVAAAPTAEAKMSSAAQLDELAALKQKLNPNAAKDTTPKSSVAVSSSAQKVAGASSSAQVAKVDSVAKDSVVKPALPQVAKSAIPLPKLTRTFSGDAKSYIQMDRGSLVVRAEDVNTLKEVLAHPDVIRAMGDVQLAFGFEEIKAADSVTKVRNLYALKKRAEMDGSNVEAASSGRSTNGANAGEMMVNLSFNSKGAKEFAKVSGNHIGKLLAIVLDSQVVSAPRINDKIVGGSAQITGNFSPEEAKQLAVILRAGALKANMHIAELRSVGATLGDDNIQISLKTGLGSLLVIAIFMVLYYHRGAVNANMGILVNILLIGAVLSMFNATLTLPGIAGIILIIGMTVDGNVLVFERIREEVERGKSARLAVHNGFSKAFSAIIDTHISTFATSYILYELGSGPIRGFGLTMMIGTATTLFCNVYLSRTLFLWLLNRDESKLDVGKGWELFKNTKVDVIALSRKTNILAMLVCVAAIVSMFVPGLHKGVDFTGGQVVTFHLPEAKTLEEVKVVLSETEGVSTAEVKEVKSQGGETYFQLRMAVGDGSDQLSAKVMKAFGLEGEAAKKYLVSEEKVGPTISKELTATAWWSIFWAVLFIIVYIWIRFGGFGLGFGLGAVVTLAHDILFTVLFFVIFQIEIDATFIAALLTILGYSLNDSIIIYDRIRENTELLAKDSYESRVNRSVNETFSRTIITSVTVFLTCLLLSIFGAGSIKNFAIAMTVGVGIGTYSSIFISAPFVNWWAKKFGVKGATKN